MQTILDEMIDRVVRHAEDSKGILPQLRLRVRTRPSDPGAAIYVPMVCLVLQGVKQLIIGDQHMRYDSASYFVSSLDLPGRGHVVEASADRPFVSVSLALDMEKVAALLPHLPPSADDAACTFGTAPVTPQVLDPWRRLLHLLDEPEDAPVLAPLLEREILYRLLRGPAGPALRQLVSTDSRLSRIRSVIGWLRRHYNRQLSIDELAGMAGMSTASFHRHFRMATGTSPLQFQKNMRLQKARVQLLAGENAACVGHAVGYESLSQFSREYARMFGAPPVRDVRRVSARLAFQEARA
ncbi:MAG: AraC family transcriptional regulator N-terminal domain-containing protein [Sphingobium sp.]